MKTRSSPATEHASAAYPPGPRGLPLLGSLPALIRDPMAFYRSMSLDYGPLAYTRLGPKRFYTVNEPALVEEFLVGQQRSYVKDPITHSLIALVGQGLLTSEGELWRRQRKLAAQPFAPKRLAGYEGSMVEAARRAFASYADGEPRDFHRDMMQLTLEIVGRTLLGVSTNEQSESIAEALEASLSYFEERIYSWGRLLPEGFPTPRRRRFLRRKAELDRVVRAIIERCRREDAQADYLLARLVRARTEGNEAMSEQQLLDEALTMVLAGHETTALAMLFATYSLCVNPEVAARLRTEVDDVLQGRPASAADLERMPFLDAVVRETLRLYPPAYAFGREIVSPIELHGYTIDKGSVVIVSPFGMHRNPQFFPDPERFEPARWLAPEASALPRFAYLPFGGGPRICIGNHFAQLELGLVLATLVQQLEVQLLPGFELELAPVLTLRSKHGLPVRVRQRCRPREHMGEPALDATKRVAEEVGAGALVCKRT
jgi:cytochrome P450